MGIINNNFLKLNESYLFQEINRRTREWMAKNPLREVLRLGVGNTTEPLTPVIVDAMHKKLDELSYVDTYTGYGDEQGNNDLRAALADFYKRDYNVHLDRNEFFISDGAKSDAGNIQELFSPSCKVAVQDPSYPVYVDSNVVGGRSGLYNSNQLSYDGFVFLNATSENGFIPSPPKEHVDIIYLCFPNNPTGAVATYEQLKAFVDYAKREKAIIIYDAAYADYIRTPGIPHTIYEIEGATSVAIEINSFSKNAGFTGVRLGWTIVPFDIEADGVEKGLLHKLWNRRQCTFFNGASNIAQSGGVAALSQEGRKECREMVDYYLGNASIILNGIKKVGFECYGGINSPYIWTRCPKGMSSWEFFDYLLNKTGVVVTPGVGFGKQGEGYVRISSYGHRENIEKAIKKISEEL